MLNKLTLLILSVLLCTMTLTACENTWHGMGRDMEETGEDMQNQYR